MSHVLIVDDDANTREALAALCETEGFTTAAAGSVAEARIQLVRQRPDVVLMDLKLPDGSGMDLFDDLEDRSSIETILITGHASVETAVEALRLGASDYLTKPVNFQRLKAILSRVPEQLESLAIDSYAVSWTQVLTPIIVTDLSATFQVLQGFQSNPYRRVRLFGTVEAQESEPLLRQRVAVQARLRFAVVRVRGALGVPTTTPVASRPAPPRSPGTSGCIRSS